MVEKTILESFSKIKSQAGSDLSFSQPNPGQMLLESSSEVKCSVSDDQLLIEGKPGLNMNFGNNFVSIGGNSVYNFNGISMSGNHINYSGGGPIYVNGRRIDLDNLPTDKTNEEPQDPNFSKKWLFTNVRPISRVNLAGSGQTTLVNGLKMNPNCLLMISGSARFVLPLGEYSSVKAKVSGSGRIDLGNSQIDNLDADISGSGSVNNFYAKMSALLTVSGSGSINGRAARGCDLDKNKSGSGSINVYKD